MISNNGAECNADYIWAENSQHVNPCKLVGNLFSAFASESDWKIPPLGKGFHYTLPGLGDMVFDKCACSWVAYNLISACTACQGLLDDSFLSWQEYSKNCSVTTEFLPSQRLPDSVDLAIPAWASVNPRFWYFQEFNVAQAREIAAQEEPDIFPSRQDKGLPISAIVGIVTGLALVVLVGIGLYLAALLRQNGRISSGGGSRTSRQI